MFEFMKRKVVVYNILLYITFGILLFCAFSNKFQWVDSKWYENWQSDSEWLVQQRIYDDLQLGFSHNYGLLGEYSGSDIGKYDINHEAYTAQVGLQGLFYGIVFKVFPQLPIKAGNCLTIIGLVMCCLFILKWVKDEFGFFSSLLSCFIIMTSKWLIVSAQNMYWVSFTLFIPMILTLILLKTEEKYGKLSLKKMFFFSVVAIFIRAACGYEFISLAMINLELPLFYYAYKNQWGVKTFITRFLLVAGAAFLGFFLAVIICIIQVYLYSGSIYTALDALIGRIGYRTGAFRDVIAYTGFVRESLITSKWSVFETYYNQGESLIVGFRMNYILPTIVFGTSFICISGKISPTIEKYRRKLASLGIMTWVSFLGPLSWFFLATGHAYIHTHICYMLWSMPFLILGLTLTGITIKMLIYDILKYFGKIRSMLGAVLLLGVGGFLFYDHYSYGTRVYSIVSENGKLLYSNDVAEVWFEEGSLYYVIDSDMALERVFLHYYPEEGNGAFINSDFGLEEKKIRTLPWSDVRIAKIEIPKDYFIDHIETGQFNGSVRFWETEIPMDFLKLSRSYDIYTLTDDNWTYGVNNLQNCLLLASNDLALYQLKGRFISISDLIECQVVDVVKQGDYFWIYVDKDIKESIDVSLLDQIIVQ